MALPLTSMNPLGAGTTTTSNASNGFHNNGSSNSTATTSSSSTSPNIYRIGDFVYIETSPSSPYQVCKIEEIIKGSNGNVEVKSNCFFRRRDISGSLIQQAEKEVKRSAFEDEVEKEIEQLPEKTRHQLKLRELYLTRQVETFPSSQIRGRCTVAQLSEAETPISFLQKDDSFFYTLVYDPQQKSLTPPERGDIRVGSRYQAEVPPKPLEDPSSEDTRDLAKLETLVYTPDHELTNEEIDMLTTTARGIGTYARGLDCTSSIKSPGLHMTIAAASRDLTTQYVMDLLHRCNYNLLKAYQSLTPDNCPLFMKDEMEEWSSAESYLFEEGIEKHDKNFYDIRQNFLPWKSEKSLIEFYYMWKTTDRYVQQKRVKAVENESRLKQVYIPNFNKQSSLNGPSGDSNVGKQCESCKKTSSSSWNALSLAQYQFCLCHSCWNFWKKFGAFKVPNRVADMHNDKIMGPNSTISLSSNHTLARPHPIADLNSQYPCRECNKVFNRQERLLTHMATHRPHKCNISTCGKEFKFKAHLARHAANSHGAHSVPMRSGSPRPIMKTRAAFYFSAASALRLARRLCGSVLNLKHAARFPFLPVNVAAFKQEYTARYAKGISPLPRMKGKNRGKVVDVSYRLGTPRMPKPEWLVAMPKDKLPQPEKLAFPPTPIHDQRNREPLNCEAKLSTSADGSRKRSIDQNGNSLPSKRRQMAPPSILGKSVPDLYENISKNAVSTSLNGRAKVATFTSQTGQKQMISWVDAPDDVCFVANDKIKQMRRKVTLAELRRAARRPWKRCGKGVSSATASLPSAASTGGGASVGGHPGANSLSAVTPNAAAAAALNLASLGQLSSSTSQQQALALLQQQMMAQNMPLLSSNHFGSNFLGMSSGGSSGNTSKLSR